MANTVDAGSASQPLLQNEQLDLDTVFDALAHSHRRAIISSLLERESGMTVDELVEDLLAVPSPTADPGKAHSRVTVAVSHSHLPKLADMGLIEWDRDQRFVEPTASLSTLRPVLDVAVSL